MFLILTVSGIYSAYLYMLETGHPYFLARRQPASIDRSHLFDVSNLSGAALEEATHKELLRGMKSLSREGEYGLMLGHFTVRGPDGSAHAACDVYDKIELQFDAEGMAVDGKRPQLSVTASCVPGRDLTRTRPIWIPYQQFKANQPSDTVYTLNDEQASSFAFKNMDFVWPHHWVLTQVRLSSRSSSKDEIFISRQELYQKLENPIVMTWAQDSRH